jgi:hypothetical protein
MIGFMVRFKYLLSFIGSIVIALAPSVYHEVKNSYAMSKVQFSHSVSKDYGAALLKATYPFYCSTDSVKKKYLDHVSSDFLDKGYTVETILAQDKVKIPMAVADAMLSCVHEASINLIDKPYIVRFDIVNNTQASIMVEAITITSDDAYDRPLWGVSSSFSMNSVGRIRLSKNSCSGYVVSFDSDRIIIPEDNTFSVIIAFKGQPFIKYANSSIVINKGGDKQSVQLSDKRPKGNLNYDVHFILTLLAIFLLILGSGYTVNHVRSYILEARGNRQDHSNALYR